jgi:hypothetical protein
VAVRLILRTYNGDEEVLAEPVGPLAVHRSVQPGEDGWRITHVATGFGVPGPMLPTLDAALAAASAILPLADWSFADPETVRREWPVGVKKRVVAAISRAAEAVA